MVLKIWLEYGCLEGNLKLFYYLPWFWISTNILIFSKYKYIHLNKKLKYTKIISISFLQLHAYMTSMGAPGKKSIYERYRYKLKLYKSLTISNPIWVTQNSSNLNSQTWHSIITNFQYTQWCAHTLIMNILSNLN